MKTYRVVEVAGDPVPLTPPDPPEDLVDAVGYDLAIAYGIYMAIRLSHVPHTVAGQYLGITGPNWLAVYRDLQDVHRKIAKKLSRTIPVMPRSWSPWLEEMTVELISFDVIARTRSRGRRMVVAFAGPDRSGKSTAARWFQSEFGGQIIGFGDAVKELAKRLKLAEDVGRGDKSCEQRMAYITLAQTIRALYDEDYWIKQLEGELKDGQWNIIDDLRFWNEAYKVGEWGGIIIRMLRPGTAYHPSQVGAFDLEHYRQMPRTKKRKAVLGIVKVDEDQEITLGRVKRFFKYISLFKEEPPKTFRKSVYYRYRPKLHV